ncbi:MAG TPA: Ku protein [Candidatus Aquilonibacter sp.]|nr:Ku protein [Candidatus Aquilonibacter sp.]
MASSAWRGFISFGLITIPVRLYVAARSARFQLHQLHRKCHTRLRQPLFCPTCNRPVERSEVVKGFEYEEGKYALIEPEEIKKIEPKTSQTMEVLVFVKGSQIDPLFFDTSYFVVPEEQGRKAYQLLLKALEDKERVAIAKVTMHQREYTAFIRPYDRGLALHTMYYANEVREAPGYGKTEGVKLTAQEVKLAEQLVENLSEDFRIQKYHDEFQDRLHALIEEKRKGHEIAAEAPLPRRAPVIDIMTALKKSLAGTAQKSRASLREHSRKGPARRAS